MRAHKEPKPAYASFCLVDDTGEPHEMETFCEDCSAEVVAIRALGSYEVWKALGEPVGKTLDDYVSAVATRHADGLRALAGLEV